MTWLPINPTPVFWPNDSEQKKYITCAHCGKPIHFDRNEVYVNGHSYVCKDHASSHPKDGKMFAVIAKDVLVTSSGIPYTTDPYYVFWREKEGFVRWPHPFTPTHWHSMPEFN